MNEIIKKQLKEYIDMLEDRDLIFLQQIYTIIKKHLEKSGRI